MTEFYFPVNLTSGGNLDRLTAFNINSSTPVYQADERHPHWREIVEGLRNGDPEVWGLFDVAGAVMNKFNAVTERVSYDGSNILFDGDPIHSTLASHLRRAIDDGNPDNYTALAKFWEKLASNPDAHSREQAYDWLSCQDFQITPDGDVVGYKGMYDNGDETYSSTASSGVKGKPSAYVNGEPQPEMSRVTQSIGDVVTMPRGEVVHDPTKSCERGLHVATHSYARSYGTVLEVHVNPRDIVSVPTDGGGEKVRACRYVVVGLASQEPSTAPVANASSNYDYRADVSYVG